MIWTAVVEDTDTGVIHTPVFHGVWSCKLALERAAEIAGDYQRVICVIKGDQRQTVHSPLPERKVS